MAYEAPSLDRLRAQAVEQLQACDVDRWRRRAVLIIAAVLVAGFLVNRILLTPPAPAPETYLPRVSTTVVAGSGGPAVAGIVPGAAAGAPTASAPMKVHVAGAVATDGVVDVRSGSRVADAIAAAGGLTDDADVDRINLAAKLADGQRVYVLRRGEAVAPPVAGSSGSSEADGGGDAGQSSTVSLNSATAKELEELPGVGPATAAAIVAYRQQKGGFSTIEEVGKVKGIGPSKLAQMKPLLTL